jgi:hypothetical protein
MPLSFFSWVYISQSNGQQDCKGTYARKVPVYLFCLFKATWISILEGVGLLQVVTGYHIGDYVRDTHINADNSKNLRER